MQFDDIANQVLIRINGESDRQVLIILAQIICALLYVLLLNKLITEKQVRAILTTEFLKLK